MSTMAERVGGRVDGSPSTVGVAVGDLAVIALFVAVGVTSHGGSPTNVGLVAESAAPFVVGWVLTSIPARLYDARVWRSPRAVAKRLVVAWLAADVIAQLIRSTPYVSGNATVEVALQFGAVSFVFGTLFLLGWRLAVAFSSRLLSTGRA